MPRIREVKKYGDLMIIPLFKRDVEDLKIKIGDKVDIEDVVFNPHKNKK